MFKISGLKMLHSTSVGGGQASTITTEENTKSAEEATAAGETPAAIIGADAPAKASDGVTEDTVTLTKEEHEQLLAKAERRGARQARTNKTAATPDPPGDDDADELMQKAQATLTLANQRYLAATVKELGSDKEISANGLKIASERLDLSKCLDEKGEVDMEAVADELDSFISEFPEFKKTAKKNLPQFQFEGNPQNGGKRMSKEEILKIRDPAKRQKAIADNINLFT